MSQYPLKAGHRTWRRGLWHGYFNFRHSARVEKGAITAVEQARWPVAQRPQQPPQSGGKGQAGVVVRHHRRRGTDPEAGQGSRKNRPGRAADAARRVFPPGQRDRDSGRGSGRREYDPAHTAFCRREGLPAKSGNQIPPRGGQPAIAPVRSASQSRYCPLRCDKHVNQRVGESQKIN